MLRLMFASVGVASICVLLRAAAGVRTSLGAGLQSRPAAFPASDHYDGNTFRNVLPGGVMAPGTGGSILKALLTRGRVGKPSTPVAVVKPSFPSRPADLAVTWLGHSGVLLEIDGIRVLADPVFAERVSPSQRVGPKRLHPSPLRLDELPPLDAVIISHDHYDHLDTQTIQWLGRFRTLRFLVPLGVGEHLRRWGVPADRISELDWNDAVDLNGIRIICTETRHFSGRGFTRNDTLWSSWAIVGPKHRVFFGGDTGYTPAFTEIGAEHGPFDVTLLPVGAYSPFWPDIHLNPEEAVRTHVALTGGVLVPIHWATFDLAFHPWSEPIDRTTKAAETAGISLLVPRPGQRLAAFPPAPVVDEWWKRA